MGRRLVRFAGSMQLGCGAVEGSVVCDTSASLASASRDAAMFITPPVSVHFLGLGRLLERPIQLPASPVAAPRRMTPPIHLPGRKL